MRCVECAEHITHPLCHECLSGEVAEWLQQVEPELVPAVSEDGGEFFLQEGTSCIQCKKKIIICMYCHTKQILTVITENNKELETEFKQMFNFEVEHLGYL